MGIKPKSSKKKVIPDIDFVGKFEVDGRSLHDVVEDIVNDLTEDIVNGLTLVSATVGGVSSAINAVGTLVNLRTLGHLFVVDGDTEDNEGVYQVPDGTSIVIIKRDSVTGRVKLSPPNDAPSVILVSQVDGDLDEVEWDGYLLSLCPISLFLRGTTSWMNVPLADAFESWSNYRMKNDTFTITGKDGIVSVPAGTGKIVCTSLTDAVTLNLLGDFYPQVILVNNVAGGKKVTFAGVDVENANSLAFANLGGDWFPLGE
ncbi:MAG TPA: hypothetical protein PLG04_00675 [Anaerolineaceae bacterium]|nr:hypothetical protein [Anaerolineaceae bacterium]